MSCAHEHALSNQFQDNLVGMVIAMKGGPCTGKTTLARALSKSLRCTLASHDDFLSCTSDAERFLSSCPSIETLPTNHFDDLSYEVLWRVAEAQLHRHHSVVIDSPLHKPAHLDRLQALSSSKSGTGIRAKKNKNKKDIMAIVIECQAQDKSEWKRRLIEKNYSPQEVEKILEEDDYDTGDIPKLTIDTTSQVRIKEHLEHMEKFILSCLDKQLYGDMPIGVLRSGCSDCKMAYVEKVTAHLPRTLKHQAHEHELALGTCARSYAFGKTLLYHCNGCGDEGMNLHYVCFKDSCRFIVHAKCALSLPGTITPSLQCSHPLVLASRPYSPDRCYCDYYMCEKKRHPNDWIYFCEECEHHYHIKCANPEFYESPELIQY